MGLLDEAIREHLDLKRRRGADPSEVDRLEREALGPVRRSPQDSPDLEFDKPGPAGVYPQDEELSYPGAGEAPDWDDEPYAEPAPFDHAEGPSAGPPTEEDWYEPPTELARVLHADEVDSPPERRSESARHHEIAEEWEAHERGLDESDEPAPAPPAPAPAPDPDSAPPPSAAPGQPVFRPEPPEDPRTPKREEFDQETAEYNVEEAEPRPPSESAKEDVLEETPDFLQDTPDHDRLWFEQRPPRDFDFDG